MNGALSALEADCRRWVLDLDPALDIEAAAAGYLRRRAPLLEPEARASLVRRVLDRCLGLGPLDAFLARPEVSEIMVNGPGPIWIETDGEVRRTDVTIDRATIDHVVERIVAPLGRRLDRSSPMVDGRLADGSRVHVAAPPVAVDGPYVTIRRFRSQAVELDEFGPAATVDLLRRAVTSRANIVVSGGTSSGKTTLLNALARLIPPDERLVTIEDAAELRIHSDHLLRLEARPRVVDGPPAIPIRELVRNALRMRPDRIIVGEVRGDETLDMVQAMNTGHEGSFSTCHANTPADALARLAAMITMEGSITSVDAAAELVTAAVDLIVHLERTAVGRRHIVAIAEPTLDADVHLVADTGGVVSELRRRPRRDGSDR